jgi:tetratricopeptide (TPR) repeat protein
MRRDAVAFALSGTLFGLLVGWMIGSQQGAAPSTPATAVAEPADASSTPTFSRERATELERQARAQPENSAVRAGLGDLYFDAERFDEAIPWYEAALTLDATNADVSNNMALAYFATTEVDRALRQLERSLAIDPRNLKALFSQGIVRARGKQDLAGAAESWQRVVEVAPDSQEGQQAQQGLEAIRAAHATSKAPAGARETEP